MNHNVAWFDVSKLTRGFTDIIDYYQKMQKKRYGSEAPKTNCPHIFICKIILTRFCMRTDCIIHYNCIKTLEQCHTCTWDSVTLN